MSKYTTLVFKADTDEEFQAIRKMALDEKCRAWSLDHELLRLDLVHRAVERKDFKKAEEYFGATDIQKYRIDLDEP